MDDPTAIKMLKQVAENAAIKIEVTNEDVDAAAIRVFEANVEHLAAMCRAAASGETEFTWNSVFHAFERYNEVEQRELFNAVYATIAGQRRPAESHE